MATRIPEKVVQQHIVRLLASVGARVYVLGTRRPRGDYQGTCQTPGIPDLLAFVPVAPGASRTHLVFIEAKAQGGRPSPAQRDFQVLCAAAGVAHVLGDLDAVIAWLVDAGLLRADRVPHYRQPAAGRQETGVRVYERD